MSTKKFAMDEKKLAERIKRLRKATGWRQKEFADKLNISRGYCSEIESGKKIPSERVIMSIAQLTKANYGWLLTGEGDMRGAPAAGPNKKKEGFSTGPTDFDLTARISEIVEDWIRRGLAAAGARAEMMKSIYELATGTENAPEQKSGTRISQNGEGNVQQVGEGNISK